MHRVELKVLNSIHITGLFIRFLMHRVELKVKLFNIAFRFSVCKFLMHRVELKVVLLRKYLSIRTSSSS